VNLSSLKDVFSINPGIESDQLNDLEAQLNRKIPDEYRDLLQAANGFTLANGLSMYPAEDVFERNETFEVSKYAPDYLAIGDNSGGRSVLIPFEGVGVYDVDQGVMDPDDMEKLAPSLTEWISNGCVV
jgi:hypothetical protein